MAVRLTGGFGRAPERELELRVTRPCCLTQPPRSWTSRAALRDRPSWPVEVSFFPACPPTLSRRPQVVRTPAGDSRRCLIHLRAFRHPCAVARFYRAVDCPSARVRVHLAVSPSGILVSVSGSVGVETRWNLPGPDAAHDDGNGEPRIGPETQRHRPRAQQVGLTSSSFNFTRRYRRC